MYTPRNQEPGDFSLSSLSDRSLVVAARPEQLPQLTFTAQKFHGTLLTEIGKPSDFDHAVNGGPANYGAGVALPLLACVLAAALLALLDAYLARRAG